MVAQGEPYHQGWEGSSFVSPFGVACPLSPGEMSACVIPSTCSSALEGPALSCGPATWPGTVAWHGPITSFAASVTQITVKYPQVLVPTTEEEDTK